MKHTDLKLVDFHPSKLGFTPLKQHQITILDVEIFLTGVKLDPVAAEA